MGTRMAIKAKETRLADDDDNLINSASALKSKTKLGDTKGSSTKKTLDFGKTKWEDKTKENSPTRKEDSPTRKGVDETPRDLSTSRGLVEKKEQ